MIPSQYQNLLLKNKGKSRLEVKNDASTIYVYGPILSNDDEAEWYGGVSANAFVQALAGMTQPNITLRINSPGGDMFAGRVMQQAIAGHASTITCIVDGLCASAATYLPLAADKVQMGEGTFMMIHKAMTGVFGNADDLLNVAGVLDQMDAELVKSYCKKTGQSVEQVTEWVKNETWFSADDCVKYGFADEQEPDGDEKTEALENRITFDLSAYNNAPKIEPKVVEPVTPTNTIDVQRMKMRLELASKN